MKPFLIDSHCHLEMHQKYGQKTPQDLIFEAKEKGVRGFLTIGTDFDSLPQVKMLSEKFPEVYHTVGIHPHDALSLEDLKKDTLVKAASHARCLAIGEIGLDTYYQHSPLEVQRQALQFQLELALNLKLPVVIHSRESEAELLEHLKAYAARCSLPSPGVIHCFSGSIAFGQECLELGFYISFSGILTFKKAQIVQLAAKTYPLERLLVETDAPFLAPEPYRGKSCEPWMVTQTALKLSELKNIPFEQVALETSRNFSSLFSINFE